MIADCDRKLVQYRAALDEGGNAATIGKWVAETEAMRGELPGQPVIYLADDRVFARATLSGCSTRLARA